MNRITLYLLVFFSIFWSCKSDPEIVEESETEMNEVFISKEQFQSENMEIGKPVPMGFERYVRVNATIVPKTNAIAEVSVPFEGLVEKILVNPGQLVQAGSTMIHIGGNTILDLQQQFTESSARIKQLKADYERIRLLQQDQIQSEKELISAESAYMSELAKHNSLEIKLRNIGLNTEQIAAGKYVSGYKLASPIKGSVAWINAKIGEFVSPDDMVVEIVDNKNLQIELPVYEKDIAKLSVGQDLFVQFNNGTETTYTAKINSVGKTIHSATKAVMCYASFEKYPAKIVNSQKATCEIVVSSDSVLAVPQSAVVKDDINSFLLALVKEDEQGYYFQKEKIETGKVVKNNIEIINKPVNDMYLLSGTYNLVIE